MTCKKRSERGFTVMELMVVVGLMAIISAIAMPSFISWLPSYRLSAGARQVAGDLQLARMKAISQNTTYRLNFISGTQYRLEKDAGFTLESGPFTLPVGITASPTGATSEFQSRGTASATDDITLTNDGGTTVRHVCIKTVGRVHIENSAC